MMPAHVKAIRELLAFYDEAGVDLAVGEAANDYLSSKSTRSAPLPSSVGSASAAKSAAGRGVAAQKSAAVPAAAPGAAGRPDAGAGAPAAPLAADAAVMAAREAARNAKSLEELRNILEAFEGCALKSTATRLVFADGNPQSRIMLVGEAPGYEEDRQGLPFVGRSGQLLDRLLAAIELDRTKVYIANVVPWRPPGNRTPTPLEAAICLPFLKRQIELCDPDVLVCLGGPSAQTLLGIKDGIMKTRGRWFAFNAGSRDIRAMATLHPAYLLRSPIAKRLVWRDFRAIKTALSN